MEAAPAPRGDDDAWRPMPDVRGVPFDAIDPGDGPLGAVLGRYLAGLADRNGVISAFGSFVPDPSDSPDE
jgi:hypothetical protein